MLYNMVPCIDGGGQFVQPTNDHGTRNTGGGRAHVSVVP